MKPLTLALIVAGSVISGGIIMKVSQRPQPVAQLQSPPATAPPPAPARPADAQATGEPDAKPSPILPPRQTREVPKPGRVQQLAATPPESPAPQPLAQAAAPAPEVPPARVEPEHVTPPPPPPALPEPHKVTLNAGTMFPVRLVDGLTSERNLPGDAFTATLDKELVVDGFVIAERGARVEGRVIASDRGGRVKGVSTLEVELIRMRTADGQNVAIRTDGFERRAEESHTDDAAKIGAGAALGAVIGAIAGGGKGAAIGAGVGGGAGAGTVMATRGKPAALPSETRITFRLKSPVTITEKVRGE
ncbi:MAG: hypothetical protein ABI806_06040 [Candidatus Solibacter sp.]